MITAHRWPRRRLAALALIALVLLGGWTLVRPASAAAHPLGNFTVNRYSRIQVGNEQVRVHYVLDVAEIPTFQEIGEVIDRNHNNKVDADEQDGYLAARAPELRRNLHLTLDGAPAELKPLGQTLSFPAGQGDLLTMRLTLDLAAEAPALSGDRQVRVEYRDDNYQERLGWKEIVVRPGPGAAVLDSTAPAQDLSDELRAYPQDALNSPLDRRTATLRYGPGAGLAWDVANANGAPNRGQGDFFTTLINAPSLTLPVMLLALLGAVAWGALHALSPGHGKTIVAAYLVGSRGTARHALFLGLIVTLTHTAGVYALGLVTLYASRYILPERLIPWLSLIMGLAVVVVGVTLFLRRWRQARAVRPVPTEQAQAHGAQTHSHAAVAPRALALVGHAHPETGRASAVADHDHAARPHARGHADAAHDHDHDHGDADHAHAHSHGGQAHSHLPLGADGRRLSWRGLLAMGISGGMVPCPTALVVLLSAIALGRIGFGLILILAFSLGLAAVLSGLGLLLIHAGRWFSRVRAGSRLARLVPIGSAALIVVLGLLLVGQALLQTGVVQAAP